MRAPALVVALAPEAVGLLAILLCFALLVIANLLIQLSQHMPGPTGLPLQAAGDWLKGNAGAAISWIENSLNAAESAIRQWWAVHDGVVSSSLHAVQSLWNAAYYTATVKLPQVAAQAVSEAEAFATNVKHEAEQLYNSAVAYAEARASAVQHEAEQLYNRAVATAQAGLSSLDAWAHQQLLNISAELETAKAAVGQSISNLGSWAHAQLGSISAELDTERARVDSISQDLSHLEHVTLPADLSQLRQAIPALVAPLIGAAVGPLGLELGRVGTQVKTIEESECLKFCNPLGNLGGALEAIDLAVLLGLVAEAAAHPAQVERELAGIAGEVDSLVGEVLSLVGVKA